MMKYKLGTLVLAIAFCSTSSAGECIDADGDGWGWNGSHSCKIGSINGGECIDSDGDGWGWNGVDTCALGEVKAGGCVDSDNDGWGWNGVASCKVDRVGNHQVREDAAADPGYVELDFRSSHVFLRFSGEHRFGNRYVTTADALDQVRQLAYGSDTDPSLLESKFSRVISFDNKHVLFIGAEFMYSASGIHNVMLRDYGDYIEVSLELSEARALYGVDENNLADWEDPNPHFDAYLINLPVKPLIFAESYYTSVEQPAVD